MNIVGVKKLKTVVDKAIADVEITDVHTHLYASCFGDMLLWGVDELLTYHYLVAEVFRWVDIPYQQFWEMSKKGAGRSYMESFVPGKQPLQRSLPGSTDGA